MTEHSKAASGSDLVMAYSALLDLYQDAYTAHHNGRGPDGCPCCAEFRPAIRAAMAKVSSEVERWRLAHAK